MPEAAYDSVMLVLNDVLHDGRVRREAAALAGAGRRVLVVGTQRARGSLPDRETLQGFEVRRVRYGRYGAGLRRPWRWFRHGLQAIQIVRLLSKIPTRAYHAHDLPALILIFLARALQREAVPVVYDSHELFLFRNLPNSRLARVWHRLTRPPLMAVEGWLARRCAATITVSDPAARALAWWYHIPRPVVVHNAIDPVSPDVEPLFDVRAAAGPGRRCVVHTGEISDRRRCLSELVAAMALLPDDVALTFLGEGESQADLARQAHDLGIGHRVVFVPPVPPEQVAAAIRTADVAAILPRPDTFNTRAPLPVKFFEALAAGLPVVAANTFALRRMVKQYGMGALCDATRPEAIAAALRVLLSSEESSAARGRVQDAQKALNWQIESGKLCGLYRKILH